MAVERISELEDIPTEASKTREQSLKKKFKDNYERYSIMGIYEKGKKEGTEESITDMLRKRK